MNLKKILSGALASFIAAGAFSVSTLSYNVGDITEKVLSTDIVTYIDGIRVPSFNIAGRTAVIAENLNACGIGFSVIYDDSTRTLTISNTDTQIADRDYFYFDTDTSSEPVGTPIMDVLYTDIRTYFHTEEMQSFNIGGYTCVYADDLAALCGTYVWDENARTVTVTTADKDSGSSLPAIESVNSVRTLSAENSVITKNETFNRWGETKKSHLIKNDDGTYTAVEVSEHINIENYDSRFNHLSSYAIKKELPIFGALYVGKDFNYIAFGQENLLDDNSREVIKIVIYNKSFVKISEVSVNNCKTAVPFDASGAQMCEDDRYLVLHTSRSQYADENGQRPQTQLTVIVDKTTWTVTNMLGKFQHNHMSHALQQFVKSDNGRLITANYSDAAPIRGAFLQELDFSGKPLHTQGIFNVGGPAAANCTGAMIGGFEVSDKGYLVSMSTIDHTLATGYSSVNIEGIDRENRDVYLLWTDKNTWELRHTCLARYTGAGLTASVPYLVNLGNDTFMILWQQFTDSREESDTLCYAFADADGNQIGSTYTFRGRLSDSCQPILSDGNVIWYVNTDNGRDFYSICADAADPSHSPVKEEPVFVPSDGETTEEAEETAPSADTDEEKSGDEQTQATVPEENLSDKDKPEITLPVEPKPSVEVMEEEDEEKNRVTVVDGI